MELVADILGGNSMMLLLEKTKKLPPDVNIEAVFACNELDLKEVNVYGFDYDYTLACYKPSMDYLLYNLGRDTLVKKLKDFRLLDRDKHNAAWILPARTYEVVTSRATSTGALSLEQRSPTFAQSLQNIIWTQIQALQNGGENGNKPSPPSTPTLGNSSSVKGKTGLTAPENTTNSPGGTENAQAAMVILLAAQIQTQMGSTQPSLLGNPQMLATLQNLIKQGPPSSTTSVPPPMGPPPARHFHFHPGHITMPEPRKPNTNGQQNGFMKTGQPQKVPLLPNPGVGVSPPPVEVTTSVQFSNPTLDDANKNFSPPHSVENMWPTSCSQSGVSVVAGQNPPPMGGSPVLAGQPVIGNSVPPGRALMGNPVPMAMPAAKPIGFLDMKANHLQQSPFQSGWNSSAFLSSTPLSAVSAPQFGPYPGAGIIPGLWSHPGSPVLIASPPPGLITPIGQKRKYTRVLPSPEPSPEGNYIGQHSQGLGGHYADSYFKRKKKN
uniref:Uncharacterized protein n=1 Tax=Timema cristinae TaxID=61476 RepID=A0A7R9GWA7_TIMCR|nr:unnamed protein product [Timema cristinae]